MTASWRSAIQAVPDLLDLIESITLDRRRVPLFGDDVATRCGPGPALPEVDSDSRTWLNGMRDGRLVQVELRARDRNVLGTALEIRMSGFRQPPRPSSGWCLHGGVEVRLIYTV